MEEIAAAGRVNPPNYRKQYAVHGEMCRFCTFLSRDFYCSKYETTVEMDGQCDSYDSVFLQKGRQFADP